MQQMTRTYPVLLMSTLIAALALSGVRPASAQHEGHAEVAQKPTDMAGMPGMAAAPPAPVRQISGPAEAAVQAFQDALQVGNRDLATGWLSPDVTIVEGAVTSPSRDVYTSQRMAADMAFLKASRVVLLDRQVHQTGDSAHIVSTARIAGRMGEAPVDVVRTETAQVVRTSQGWRLARLEWASVPAADAPAALGQVPAPAPAGAQPQAPTMDHAAMPMGTASTVKPAAGAKTVAPPPMDHSKMPMGMAPTAGARPAVPAPMGHSKMPMGAPPAATPATGAKPSAPVPMDHSKMPMGTAPADESTTAVDPVCGLKVDRATAPQVTHESHAYSFCSEQHQQLFQKNPAKYLPKGPHVP